MSLREDLIENAVGFLKDPTVASAPLSKKIEFLQSKELTEAEIDEALKRSKDNSTSATSTPDDSVSPPPVRPLSYPQQQYYTAAPPPVPERDWKDYFIMATATVGVGYALYEITKRYLIPNILPESKTKLEQDKEAIDQEFLRIEATLNEITETNKELKENEIQKSKDIAKAIEDVEDVIVLTKAKNSKIEDDVKYLKSEIENLKNSFERSIDKQQHAISVEVASIQSELKSLQQLIKSKNSVDGLNGSSTKSPIPTASSIPSASEILKRANLNNTNSVALGSSPSPSPPQHATSIPSWQTAKQTVGSSPASSAIPAWQRESQKDVELASSRPTIPAWQQSSSSSSTNSANSSPAVSSTTIPSWQQQLLPNQTNASIPSWQANVNSNAAEIETNSTSGYVEPEPVKYTARETIEIPKEQKFEAIVPSSTSSAALPLYKQRETVEIPSSHKLDI